MASSDERKQSTDEGQRRRRKKHFQRRDKKDCVCVCVCVWTGCPSCFCFPLSPVFRWTINQLTVIKLHFMESLMMVAGRKHWSLLLPRWLALLTLTQSACKKERKKKNKTSSLTPKPSNTKCCCSSSVSLALM